MIDEPGLITGLFYKKQPYEPKISFPHPSYNAIHQHWRSQIFPPNNTHIPQIHTINHKFNPKIFSQLNLFTKLYDLSFDFFPNLNPTQTIPLITKLIHQPIVNLCKFCVEGGKGIYFEDLGCW